uniref:Uncharacterized protein n=1 Tax=Anguilla anguilla TaxID=7936 RepID=A0A0E9QUQ9_ANGAN
MKEREGEDVDCLLCPIVYASLCMLLQNTRLLITHILLCHMVHLMQGKLENLERAQQFHKMTSFRT